ncbi:MAG: MopE-related protein [Sandaracinus sp.]
MPSPTLPGAPHRWSLEAAHVALLSLSLGLMPSCTDTPPPADGGADASTTCARDVDCDDGIFCNGTEHCMPLDAHADAQGCVASPPPCSTGHVCDETGQRCDVDCDVASDADGDGALAIACGGQDCADDDAQRYPGRGELCDVSSHDEDCDPSTFGMRDLDGDGFTDARCCNGAGGSAQCGDDCDDTRRSVSPNSPDVCDHLDDDCDGAIDEGVSVSGFVDADADGAGDPSRPVMGCFGDRGFVETAGDCDDTSPEARPGLGEACDGVDNDCDPATTDASDAGPQPWYRDADGDGYGSALAAPVVSCARPSSTSGSYSLAAGDCRDDDGTISPVAPELCNARDDDCDGRANFAVAGGGFEDDDGDGAADAACGGDDCDDLDWQTRPGAPELADGRDNDCDGTIDEAPDPTRWYEDDDDDGYGNDAVTMQSATPVAGYVQRGGDCVPYDGTIHPTAPEICDGIDQNCDGTADEGLLLMLFPDADGDGYGDAHRTAVTSCSEAPGLVHDASDCDDTSPRIHPGAPDACNDVVDGNCDGRIDDRTCTTTPVLSFLRTSVGRLEPAFSTTQTSYTLHLGFTSPRVTVTPFCTSLASGTCAVVDGTSRNDGVAASAWSGDDGAMHTIVGPDGRSYQVTIAREGCRLEYVQALTPQSGATFGSSLAADGRDLVVGASRETSSAGTSGAGATYVYTVPLGGGVRPIARLVPSVQDDDDRLGTSTAICGDDLYGTAFGEDGALGAPLTDNSAPQAGAVHHFRRRQGRWQWSDVMRASITGTEYGRGLACDRQSGSVVVSSHYAVIDVFDAADTTTPRASWTGPAGSLYGQTVGIAGDRVIVSEMWTGNNEGSARVYGRDLAASTYSQLQVVSPFGQGPWDNFGTAMAMDGSTVVFGSLEESALAGIYGTTYPGLGTPVAGCTGPELDYGGVYVFERGPSQYALAHYVKSPRPYCKDDFGRALALRDDLLLVGAPREDTAGTGVSFAPRANPGGPADAGGAYLYVRDGTTWVLAAHLEADVRDASDTAGAAVALGDHFLAFSATGDDSGVAGSPSDGSATNAGAVWVCSWD